MLLMKADWRTRFGFWLERFAFLERFLFRYDGVAPGGRLRYINRVNGHCVVRSDFQ